MNLQVNQNRQFFVATANSGDSAPDVLGEARFVSHDNCVYLEHYGKGGLVRSDLIPIENILHYSKTVATKGKPQAVQVSAPSAIIAGRNYILNITLNNFISGGDESTYMKHGVIHTTSNMSSAEFAKKLAISVAQNFYREMNPFVKVMYNSTEVKPTDTYNSSTDSATSFTLIANPIDNYIRGISAYRMPNFTVSANLVYDSTAEEDVEWLSATDVTSSQTASIPNTYTIADMEYFCMGERGDQYRTLGNVPVNPTEYMIDISNTDGYDTIDIHYYYTGDNESVQKSEKTITIACPYAASNSVAGSLYTALQAIVEPE